MAKSGKLLARVGRRGAILLTVYAAVLFLGLGSSAYGAKTSWFDLNFGALTNAKRHKNAKHHGPGATPSPATCGSKGGDTLGPGNASVDLVVQNGVCTVTPGMYMYRNINVISNGQLVFADGAGKATDLWAANILIESGGTVRAGSVDNQGNITPIAGPLTIHLYGTPQDPGAAGAACVSDNKCGAGSVWGKNDMMMKFPPTCTSTSLPGPVDDCFYDYDAMPFDNGKPTTDDGQKVGYYGYKVIGLGYNGSLQLYGKRGATYDNVTGVDPSNSGTSWVRLNNCPNKKTDPINFCSKGVLQPKANKLVLSKPVDWQVGDNIVVSPTDYLPDHGEQVQIIGKSPSCTGATCDTFTFKQTDPAIANDNTCPNQMKGSCVLQFPHDASQYPLSKIAGSQKPTGWSALDTRAAVGLLTRSIRIVSGGNNVLDPFPAEPAPIKTPIASPTPGYYFGGHMVIRQGFAKLQIQGVEFYQMGQGGRLGHYPIHFHMARKVPAGTFVKDSSIWDSMTRWIVLHATQGVLLDRNVGYKSIGHGYYLEDGTETENKLYANLGVFARAAIINDQNRRQVPGILAAPDYPFLASPPNPPKTPADPSVDVVPFHSDWDHPSAFWIMNGWNDFEYNMASGTGTCGVCYWMLPGINSGASRKMNWINKNAPSYASEQQLPDAKTPGGTTPVQVFTGNTCVSSMASFLTIGNATACNGVQIGANKVDKNFLVLNPAAGSLAPSANSTSKDSNGFDADNYYPHIGGGGRFPSKCPDSGDCSTVKICPSGTCVVTILDHYMSSFTWAETNFASIWLRPQWYLFINGAITDAQNGGITMVTGGGYTRSDAAEGHWDLAKKTVFVGNTQNPASNPFASNAGPFNPGTKLGCDHAPNYGWPGNYCLDQQDGVSFAKSNFANNQRMLSIYDGPMYEDSNAYLDVTATRLPADDVVGCKYPGENNPNDNNSCATSQYAQAGQILGMPYDTNGQQCYLPNAAIAWKQPNGFYYPPAFHSQDLFFSNVDIRHFVIEPLFDPNSQALFRTNLKDVKKRYCTYNNSMFEGYTDIDRQTELSDDDGTLTGLTGPTATPTPNVGLIGSISVNQDPFFQAPVRTPECRSDVGVTPGADPANFPGTAVTSPYDYVSTIVFPGCATNVPTKDANCGTVKRQPDNHDGPYWDHDCTNQHCYGVPLYREYLLKNETSPVPIRMAGQDTFQRSTLTANNGKYYIDTTGSLKAEDKPQGGPNLNPITSINLFLPGKTYYVFDLFAKPTTAQTFDLYVGTNFNKDDTNQLWLMQMDLPSQFVTSKHLPMPAGTTSYSPSTGVLSVTLDMSKISNFQSLYNSAMKDKCQPATFCQWKDSPGPGLDNCQCADSIFSPPSKTFQSAECSTTNGICSWATKDVDCPEGGCFGFGFTIPQTGFVASDNPPVPKPIPTPFPGGKPWAAPFNGITDTSDACYYKSIPTGSDVSDFEQDGTGSEQN